MFCLKDDLKQWINYEIVSYSFSDVRMIVYNPNCHTKCGASWGSRPLLFNLAWSWTPLKGPWTSLPLLTPEQTVWSRSQYAHNKVREKIDHNLEHVPFITSCPGLSQAHSVDTGESKRSPTRILKRFQHLVVFDCSYSTLVSVNKVIMRFGLHDQPKKVFNISYLVLLNISDREKLKRRNSANSKPSISPKSDSRLMIFPHETTGTELKWSLQILKGARKSKQKSHLKLRKTPECNKEGTIGRILWGKPIPRCVIWFLMVIQVFACKVDLKQKEVLQANGFKTLGLSHTLWLQCGRELSFFICDTKIFTSF